MKVSGRINIPSGHLRETLFNRQTEYSLPQNQTVVFVRGLAVWGKFALGGHALKNHIEFAVLTIIFIIMSGQNAEAKRYKSHRHGASGGGYYVEFRARKGDYIVGHSYIVLGKRGRRSRKSPRSYGLYPARNQRGNPLGYLNSKAIFGSSHLDRRLRPVVRYRVKLDARKYRKLKKYVRYMKRRHGRYNVIANNCNTFIGKSARVIGLKTPQSNAYFSANYVRLLISANRNRR